MMWKISDKPDNSTILNPGISLDPPDDVVQALFIGTHVHWYPHLLHNAVLEKLYGTNIAGVRFYKDLNAEDFFNKDVFEENEVRISHEVFGESVIYKSLFFEILYEYAEKLLAIYRIDENVQNKYQSWLQLHSEHNFNPNWAQAMEEELKNLKQKKDNQLD